MDMGRHRDRERHIGTERWRDRVTERQRDIETDVQRNTEIYRAIQG